MNLCQITINASTRYSNQHLVECESEEQRLDFLSEKLDREILQASDILRMELLEERYLEDALAARADDRIGYYMRYLEAQERLHRLINAKYAPHRPVSDSGGYNGC